MQGSWVLFILIFVSSIPMIAVYLWFRIAKYQFSVYQFLFALLAGAAAFFCALILQDIIPSSLLTHGRMALFFHFFIRIAFTEEASRLLMLFIFFWINGRISDRRISSRRIQSQENPDQPLSYNTVIKGTAVGLVAGLGFAILESAVYAASDAGVLLLRIFTAALHGACGSRVGAAAVMLRTNPVQAVFRILTAVAIHGVYNFMVSLPGLPSIAAVIIAISTLITAIITIRSGWSTGWDTEPRA